VNAPLTLLSTSPSSAASKPEQAPERTPLIGRAVVCELTHVKAPILRQRDYTEIVNNRQFKQRIAELLERPRLEGGALPIL
jgi:hypothetical protein